MAPDLDRPKAPPAPPRPTPPANAPAAPLRVIGKALRKIDARPKVTGQTRFADDLVFPRMLHCKLLRSTRPFARIRRIDLERARALPGVVEFLVGDELPETFGILPVSQDEHALCVEKVRYVGDPVAAIAALDEEKIGRASCRERV